MQGYQPQSAFSEAIAAPKLSGGLIGDGNQPWFAGDLDQKGRIHRFDDRRALLVLVRAHQHVAGQQQPDFSIDVDRAVCQRGVARTEYQVVLHVHTELGLERCFDVDLGQHAKPLSLEGFLGAFDRPFEVRRQVGRQRNAHSGYLIVLTLHAVGAKAPRFSRPV